MRRKILVSGFVLLSAMASAGCWLYEIYEVHGWRSLSWLNGFQRSAFLSVAFVTLAAMLPALPVKEKNYGRLLLAFVLLYGIGMIAFAFARTGFYMMFSRFAFPSVFNEKLIGGALLLCLGYFIIFDMLVRPMRVFYPVLLLLAILACWGLSLLSISIFPAHGHDDFIHTIKAGHQQFWIGITLAIATALGKKANGQCAEPKSA